MRWKALANLTAGLMVAACSISLAFSRWDLVALFAGFVLGLNSGAWAAERWTRKEVAAHLSDLAMLDRLRSIRRGNPEPQDVEIQ